MDEFDVITKYFTRQPQRGEVKLGVGDDCALIEVPAGKLLALSTDTLVENTHFFPSMPAKDLGYKSLAVNLSDLAAMGAEPITVLLSLTLSKIDSTWLQNFADGFLQLAEQFNVDLIGGNIAKGPLSISVQVQGLVEKQRVLQRSTAKPGDLIFVSGELGAAAACLRVNQQKLSVIEPIATQLTQAWHRPQPQVTLGLALSDYATAAIDISDGLLADLNHLLTASHVGAVLQLANMPIAESVKSVFSEQEAMELALTGGEDYQLCFTAPASRQAILENKFHCKTIGYVEEQQGLRLLQSDGSILPLEKLGFQHF